MKEAQKSGSTEERSHPAIVLNCGVASIDPRGKRTTTVYNTASQTLATIDANGNRVFSVYDTLGRRTVEINGLGNRTTTVYNTIGQTSALVDARANRHSFTYDSTGAQTQLIDPLNRRTTSAYDAAGQQSVRIDARSNRTSFVYNSVGQLTSRKYPDGSRTTLAYDTVGNRTLMADSTGRYTSTYDALGQTVATASPNSQRATYSFDTVGTRRSMNTTGSGRFTYLYDLAGQITSLRNPFSERTTYIYDDAGRRTVQRNANGTRVSMAYDAASQTTQVIHRTSAAVSLLQLDYKYDPAGHRSGMAENVSAARTTWSYDKQNQLLGEYRTGTNPYRQTFTYDAASNRTLKNIDAVRTTYAYDVANQLKYGQAAAGRTTFAYDLTGNQRVEQPPAGNRTTTTWNYENQPTQYLLPAGSPVTMSYNGDNRRVISQQGATSTKFVWDSTTDAYLSELDGVNAVQAVYTNEPQQYGSVVSQRRASTSHWLHADDLGTTRRLTSSTQTTTDSYLLDAWGNPITSSGTTVNPFRWVGRYGYYQDAATGLVYVRARMYQPATARWQSVDPLGFDDYYNLFQYTGNTLLFVDPSGQFSQLSGIPYDCTTNDTEPVSSDPRSGNHQLPKGVNMTTINISTGTCGYFYWQVIFVKPAPSGKLGSYVLQHIRFRLSVYACGKVGCDETTDITLQRMLGAGMPTGNIDNGNGWEFFEAWQFPPNDTRTDSRIIVPGATFDDAYSSPNFDNSCGVAEIVGSYTECSGKIPSTMIRSNPDIPVAPLNFSSFDMPDCKDPSGKPVGAPGSARWRGHSITMKWCCCRDC